MKKYTVLLLCLLLAAVLLLAGCGSKEATTEIEIATLKLTAPGEWRLDGDHSTLEESEYYRSGELGMLIQVNDRVDGEPYVTALAFDTLEKEQGYTTAQIENDAATAIYYGYKKDEGGKYAGVMQIVKGFKTYIIVTQLEYDEADMIRFFEAIGNSVE